MPIYFFVYMAVLAAGIFLLIRYLILRRVSLPAQLYNKGLKIENCGNFEEALITYENALNEVKKIRFHQRLKNRIIEKLKVLHTINTFEKDQKFIREKDSWLS